MATMLLYFRNRYRIPRDAAGGFRRDTITPGGIQVVSIQAVRG